MAKGAIPVATERKKDLLQSKVRVTSIDLMGYSYLKLFIDDKEALRELSESTYYSMLLIADSRYLELMDNEGNSLAPNSQATTEYKYECNQNATDSCREVKIMANLGSKSFKAILISNIFKGWIEYLAFPVGIKSIFVDTIESDKVYYAYRDSQDLAKTVKIKI